MITAPIANRGIAPTMAGYELNRLSQLCALNQLEFKLGNQPFKVCFLEKAPEHLNRRFTVSVQILGTFLRLELNRLPGISAFSAMFSGMVFPDMPDELKGLALESVFNHELDRFEAWSGVKLELMDVRCDTWSSTTVAPLLEGETMVWFELEGEGAKPIVGRLTLSESVLDRLLPVLQEPWLDHSWSDQLPSFMSLLLGYTKLPLTHVADLKAGALILVEDHPELFRKKLWAKLPNGQTWLSQYGNGNLHLEASLELERSQSFAADQAVKIDELTVELAFEVYRRTLSLRDLAKIQPGFVIEQEEPSFGNLTILANGRALGWGELVFIKNKLAVRITGTCRR